MHVCMCADIRGGDVSYNVLMHACMYICNHACMYVCMLTHGGHGVGAAC